MSRSLHARLLAGIALATMLILAASSLAVYGLMRSSLLAEFDSALVGKARSLAALVEADHEDGDGDERMTIDRVPEAVRAEILRRAKGRTVAEIERKTARGRFVYEVEVRSGDEEAEFEVQGGPAPEAEHRPVHFDLEFAEGGFPELERGERPEYLQVWQAGGHVLYASPSLDGHTLPRRPTSADAPVCGSTTLPDGRRGRMATLTFEPRGEHHEADERAKVTLALARDTADVDHTLARLRSLLVAVCVLATVVSAGVLTWLVKVGLRPVAQLARQIGDMGEDDLSVRIAEGRAPAELLPVVARLNELLARLEAAFEREKSFSADVAHELRTPLAGLRTTLEVALAGERDLALFEEGLGDSLGITCEMHAMVENLLAMARCEAGHASVTCEPVDLHDLLRECWGQAEEQAAARGLSVEWQLGEPCTLQTDRDALRLILVNVLGNALAHSDEGGRVRIATESRDGRVELRVTNSGTTLSEGQVGHVFERFWRGDAARSATGVHCGLGLGLCERLTRRLGGRITAASHPSGDFVLTLVFEQ